jgi:hypothetical protein
VNEKDELCDHQSGEGGGRIVRRESVNGVGENCAIACMYV